MVRLISIFFAVAIALYATNSQAGSAQPVLEGLENPRLQTAIDVYLDGEPLGAITELAALARNGNEAAQALLWRLEYRVYDDLPDLSRGERWRLYRDPSPDGRPSRWPMSWAISDDLRDNPLITEWGRVREEQDPVAWIGYARRMVAAAEREYVLRTGLMFLTTHPFVAEFLDEIATADDYCQGYIWATRWFSDQVSQKPPGSAPAYWTEGWTGSPWGPEQEAEFRQAFRGKRLVALMFQSWRNRWAGETPAGDTFVDRTYDRLVATLDWVRGTVPRSPPPTPAERVSAGALLVAEARRGTYLTPLLRICEAHCAKAVEACMFSGLEHTGVFLGLAEIGSPLEVVIPQDGWRNSVPAREDVRRLARARLDYWARERARGAESRMPSGGCFAQWLAESQK